MARPTQARLNLHALHHNVQVARKLAPDSRLMAVVKANGYGHGAVTVAQALEPLADALAVASIEEAVELREAGINAPILLLEGVFEPAELALADALKLWVTIDNEQQLQWLERARLEAPLNCWLKVDTGMHRLGVSPQQTRPVHQRLLDSTNSTAHPVIYTHFASADELDSPQTPDQIRRFDDVCSTLPALRSAANSPGVLAWPQAHYDWIRPGYMLYGNSPFPCPHAAADSLRPTMTLVSAVISLRDVRAGETVGYGATWQAQRDSRIATVTIGYGDGYPRLAANGTPVLVRGQRATLAGRVSMDMITVDVTDIPDTAIGDEVILWGDNLPIGEVARHAQTIGYELSTRMPPRTPRIVIG
tara:strand:+ start:276855 stop:277937 length:1083 start_codon:yes stop_codon:yes gene_type:complete